MPAVVWGAARVGDIKGDGSWRVWREAWFYGPAATAGEVAELRSFIAANTVPRGGGPRADRVWADETGVRVEQLMPLDKFIAAVFYSYGFGRRGSLVIGHDLPAVLGALALDAAAAEKDRRPQPNSFSLTLHRHEGRENRKLFPRVIVEHARPEVDLVRFGAWAWGQFLSTKAVAYGLTAEPLPFDAAVAKMLPDGGHIAAAIGDKGPAGMRVGTRALADLAGTLVNWFDLLHPDLSRGCGGRFSECSIYSPGSIARFYMERAGYAPPPQLDDEMLGLCATATLGALCGVNLKGAVPVVETDFRREYAVIYTRQEIGRLVAATRLQLVEATDEIRQLAAILTERDLGPLYNAVCLIETDDQPMLTRARFHPLMPAPQSKRARFRALPSGLSANDFGLAMVERTTAGPIPAFLAHVIASRMLDERGRVPTIIKAWRIVPEGEPRPLYPIDFMGRAINPLATPLPLAFVQEGALLDGGKGRYADIPKDARPLLVTGLKSAGNVAAYGELLRADQNEPAGGATERVTLIYDGPPLEGETAAPEDDGPFTCVALGGLVAGSGAMLVASICKKVRDRGGIVAAYDTDSAHICASKEGGDWWLRPVIGADGHGVTGVDYKGQRIRLLSWAEVREICAEYESLNPFPDSYPGSILRVTSVNFDEVTGEQIQLIGHYLAPKRYSLEGPDGRLTETMASGIGPYLSPLPPEVDDVAESWRYLNAALAGKLPPPSEFGDGWLDAPLVRELSVSTPAVRESIAPALPLHPGATYLAGQVSDIEDPDALDKSVVASGPRDDRAKWALLDWCYPDGSPIDWRRMQLVPRRAHLEGYARVAINSMLGPDGKVCNGNTRGLLTRRHMRDGERFLTLKEAVTYGEELADAFDLSAGDLFAVNKDAPRKSVFEEVGRPAIAAIGTGVIAGETKLPRPTIKDWARDTEPHNPARALRRIAEAAYGLGLVLTHADGHDLVEICRIIPERVRLSQAFASLALVAFVNHHGMAAVAAALGISPRTIYARMEIDEQKPLGFKATAATIAGLAEFCAAVAEAEGHKNLRFALNGIGSGELVAVEPGPLGHRQIILAWLDWIGPDRFPGDRGPRLPGGAKIYAEIADFVRRSEPTNARQLLPAQRPDRGSGAAKRRVVVEAAMAAE